MATDEPMMATVAGRYAAALFELATETKSVSMVEKDLGEFERLMGLSDDLKRLVRSPVFSPEDQSKAVGAVLDKAGLGATVVNFFRLLAENRRLYAAPDVVRAFRALAAKARGEVAAEVASAVPLTDAQVMALKDTLKASVGKDVALALKVDPSLLGGLVVKMGSRMVDSSLRTKLSTMKVSLKGGV